MKVYFLPGTMMDKRLWQMLKPFFYKEVEAIYLDIPIAHDFDDLVDNISQKIQNDAFLVGFSLGAYLGASIALKYPSKIRKLILISSSFSSLNHKEIEERKKALELVEKFGFKGISKKKILSLLSDENQNNENLVSIVSNMYEQSGKENFVNQLKITTNRKSLDLKSLSNKTMIIYGKEDYLINKKDLSNLKNYDILLEELDTKSHLLPLEYPEKIAKSIINYLKD